MKPRTPHHRLRENVPDDIRRQETARLFAEAERATGAERDRFVEEIILINICVACTIANRYAGRGIALEDLESAAYLALVRAVQNFDSGKGDDFLVYAVPTIRGEVKHYFRDHGWMVRPPRRVQELQLDVLTAQNSHDREVTTAQIAAELNVDVTAVHEALAVNGCFAPTSLDVPANGADADSEPLSELLPSPDQDLGRAEMRILLANELAKLGERERIVVRMRYLEDRRQAEIGEHIGVTQMQVSRILTQILDKLRNALAETDLAVP